jgi:serine/threonine protein kinase
MEIVKGRTAEVTLLPEFGRVIKTYIWYNGKVPKGKESLNIPNTKQLEVAALRKLHGLHYFPDLIEERENSIIMTHCGEKLTYKNMPHDYDDQTAEIIKLLALADIVHRDIRPDNLMILGRYIRLIDFGWATTYADKENIDIEIGGEWKNAGGYNDRYSMMKSIESIRKKG